MYCDPAVVMKVKHSAKAIGEFLRSARGVDQADDGRGGLFHDQDNSRRLAMGKYMAVAQARKARAPTASITTSSLRAG